MWEPINDYPDPPDQLYDYVPGTPETSYWGEIGSETDVTWSWTIIATNDLAETYEVDGGIVATEDAAKHAVEAWTPQRIERTSL